MKSYKYLIINFLSFCFLFFSACQVAQVKTNFSARTLPTNFSEKEKNEQPNIAQLSWRKYFTDSTLLALIDTALQNNPDLGIALQKMQSQAANLHFAKGLLLPTGQVGTIAALRKYGLYTMDGAGNATTDITPNRIVPEHLPDYFVGLQTIWEADIWGKLRNQKKAAYAEWLGSIEAKNLIITMLIAEVAQNYYELLALDQELVMVRRAIELQKQALEIVQVQKQAGTANELAVKQFEAQVLHSKGLEIKLLQEITETENSLNVLLGSFSQRIVRNSNQLDQVLPTILGTGIPSDLLRNRPDIRQAEWGVVASKANLQAAKAAFYPSFIINASAGFQAFDTRYWFSSPQSIAYSLVGGLAAPLINRSAIQAKFRNAHAQQIGALYEYQKSILNAYAEVRNEIVRLQNLQNLYELKIQETQALQAATQAALLLFRTGKANYLEVLLAQSNTLQTQIEQIETQKMRFQAVVQLYKALGGGWQE